MNSFNQKDMMHFKSLQKDALATEIYFKRFEYTIEYNIIVHGESLQNVSYLGWSCVVYKNFNIIRMIFPD